MRGDTPVAKVHDDKITSLTPAAPLYLQSQNSFPNWLKDRGADLTRSNMRIILKQFGLPQQDISAAVRMVNAASVTDSFWIKPHGSSLSYEQITFKKDIYAKAALCGDPDIFLLDKTHTPEMTNIGSFNKGWKLVKGKWHLYKSGTELEIFSELFTAKLARHIGLNGVNYFIDEGFIVCESFVAAPWDFEPAKSIIGDNCDYQHVYPIMEAHGLAKEYMDIIFMDAIVRNSDRHEFNFGFLTSTSGAIKLAPNFDNNLALFCRGIPSNLERNDPLVTDFASLQPHTQYMLPKLTESMIVKAHTETINEYPANIPLETTINFCINAYSKLQR